MSKIVEDALIGAEWISQALQSSDYHADFSPESLWQIDFFFDDHSRNGEPIPGGLLSEQIGSRLFALGAYVGEVLRRNIGGEWQGDNTDPQAEINIILKLASGSLCWPVQRAIKRFKNGPEDSIAAVGVGIGLQVGIQPEHSHEVSSKKPWWKFWQELSKQRCETEAVIGLIAWTGWAYPQASHRWSLAQPTTRLKHKL